LSKAAGCSPRASPGVQVPYPVLLARCPPQITQGDADETQPYQPEMPIARIKNELAHCRRVNAAIVQGLGQQCGSQSQVNNLPNEQRHQAQPLQRYPLFSDVLHVPKWSAGGSVALCQAPGDGSTLRPALQGCSSKLPLPGACEKGF